MDRKYFTIIPNIVDDLKLSPYAFRLYCHIKRVTGEDGICWQNRDTLAEFCQMSTGQISKVKQELVGVGLIRIEKQKKSGGELDVIRVLDIWPENMKQYKTHSYDEIGPSRDDGGPSPGDTKKNPIKNNPITTTATTLPDAGKPAPPVTIDGWLDLVRKAKNKVAALSFMYKSLYPEHNVPGYSYIGKVAKGVGGAPRLAQLLWIACGYRPTGDVLRYVQSIHRQTAKIPEPEKKNGRAKNPHFATSLGPSFAEIERMTDDELRSAGLLECRYGIGKTSGVPAGAN